MEQDTALNPVELGRHLMQVRERGGVKQAELAKRVSLSQAVLSRIESGDRPVTVQEVQDILAQLATPEAAELSKVRRDVYVSGSRSVRIPSLLQELQRRNQEGGQ